MSDVLHITDAETVQMIMTMDDEAVILFTAPGWCQPCKRFEIVFPKVAEAFDDTTFVAVDIDEATWAVKTHQIQSVPTIKLFRAGVYIKDLQESNVINLTKEIQDA